MCLPSWLPGRCRKPTALNPIVASQGSAREASHDLPFYLPQDAGPSVWTEFSESVQRSVFRKRTRTGTEVLALWLRGRRQRNAQRQPAPQFLLDLARRFAAGGPAQVFATDDIAAVEQDNFGSVGDAEAAP